MSLLIPTWALIKADVFPEAQFFLLCLIAELFELLAEHMLKSRVGVSVAVFDKFFV